MFKFFKSKKKVVEKGLFVSKEWMEVVRNGKYGFINREGTELLPPVYDKIEVEGDTIFAFKNGVIEAYSVSELMKEKAKAKQ